MPPDNIPNWINNIDPKRALFKGRAYFFAKRVMDVSIILVATPVVLPLLLLIALLIKLESPEGAALYTQLRTGKGGNLFRLYKFRTMVPNAEQLKEKYAHLNELQWPDFKIKDDPRVTKAGKFLRKTSLDELPQLLNVLKGDMSLVGPRPTDFGTERYKIWHTERLDVAPGITGIWQITARAESEFDERLRLDILYTNKRCIKLDILILFYTIPAVVGGEGAF